MMLASMLYFLIVAHKTSCHTLSKAFLKAMRACRFASFATLVDEDADLDSMVVTHLIKAVTDAAAELLGKQRLKRLPVRSFCNHR